MENEGTISDYAADSGARLQFLLRLRGGLADEPDPEHKSGSRLTMRGELPSLFEIDNHMQPAHAFSPLDADDTTSAEAFFYSSLVRHYTESV